MRTTMFDVRGLVNWRCRTAWYERICLQIDPQILDKVADRVFGCVFLPETQRGDLLAHFVGRAP